MLALKRKLCYQHCVSRFISSSFIRRNSNNVSDPEEKVPRSSTTSILVGPPHPVSNLRLKVFPDSKSLTPEERFLHQKSLETQEFNHKYWESHNKDFSESQKAYIQELARKKDEGSDYRPSIDEMAEFYRQFLNKNYEKHFSYNWQWYKRNFHLIFLSLKAELSKLKIFNRSKS